MTINIDTLIILMIIHVSARFSIPIVYLSEVELRSIPQIIIHAKVMQFTERLASFLLSWIPQNLIWSLSQLLAFRFLLSSFVVALYGLPWPFRNIFY